MAQHHLQAATDVLVPAGADPPERDTTPFFEVFTEAYRGK